jgi:hypothetical protein
MMNPTPNKKARKNEHYDEYRVMKSRLKERKRLMLCCGAI